MVKESLCPTQTHRTFCLTHILSEGLNLACSRFLLNNLSISTALSFKGYLSPFCAWPATFVCGCASQVARKRFVSSLSNEKEAKKSLQSWKRYPTIFVCKYRSKHLFRTCCYSWECRATDCAFIRVYAMLSTKIYCTFFKGLGATALGRGTMALPSGKS